MAYRRTSRSGGYSRGRTTRTRATYSRGRKRAGSSSRRVAARPQTLRIELVGVPANPISRSVPPSMVKAPTKAKF